MSKIFIEKLSEFSFKRYILSWFYWIDTWKTMANLIEEIDASKNLEKCPDELVIWFVKLSWHEN